MLPLWCFADVMLPSKQLPWCWTRGWSLFRATHISQKKETVTYHYHGCMSPRWRKKRDAMQGY
jgi:hypothetical protein